MNNIVNAVTRVTDIMGGLHRHRMNRAVASIKSHWRFGNGSRHATERIAGAGISCRRAALEEQASRLTQAVSAFRLEPAHSPINRKHHPVLPVSNHGSATTANC